MSEISRFAQFSAKKIHNKHETPSWKKPLRFVKIAVLLKGVLTEIMSEISRFALFLAKKHPKKHHTPS